MPRAQHLQSFSFPGYSFSANEAAVSFDNTLVWEIAIPALVAAQTGTLTTRTDDNTGVATLSTGHGLTTGMIVDVYFAAGVRYGMTCTVSGVEITLDLGAGTVLPTEDDPVTVVQQTLITASFDGDDAEIIGVFYRNATDTGAKASADFQDTGDASIEHVDLVHETANGGLDKIWNISAGDTNAFTGNAITHIQASHDSTSAGTLYVCVGLDATA